MQRFFCKLLLIFLSVFNSFPGYLIASNDLITVASFTTSISDQDENVKRNIMLSCDRLNGAIISPKSIFSFNETVGEGSAKNGYFNARVLYCDGIRMEPGGGLCQVSSTLFNVFLLAGCIIIERHRHFQPVTYVPLGLDATIKYGKKDLRIKNPYMQNLRIEISANDKSLMVIIKAEKKLPYRYEIYTEEENIHVPISDDSDRIRHGISVYVYRKRLIGNKLIDSSLLYRDFYPPVYIR